MKYKDNQFIVTTQFSTLTDTFAEGTVLNLLQKNSDTWNFSTEDNRILIMNPHFPNNYIKNTNDHLAEQFKILDEKRLHFGQLPLDETFFLDGHFHTKIGSYTMYEGTENEIVINTVKQPVGERLFDIDNYDSFKNSSFLFIEDNFVIAEEYITYHNPKKEFVPLEELQVSEYYVLFPKMFDVLASFFEKKELSPALQIVFDEYEDHIDNEAECSWKTPEYFAISQIKEQIKLQGINEHNQEIMQQIELETQQFKQNLMKKRLR